MKRSTLYLLLMAALLVAPVTLAPAAESQIRIQIGAPAPYYYSPVYCDGCQYGYYGGRWGYHRGEGYRHEEGHERDHHEYHPGGNNHQGHNEAWRAEERARLNWEREHR